MTEKYQELKSRLATIHDLRMARAILGWDQHTKMPPKAGPLRAEHLGTLDRFTHELFIDDEIGKLLEDVRGYEESLDPDSDDACLIRVTRRDYEKASRVSPDLRAEMTRSGAIALAAWVEAREKSDFSIFLPYLKKNVELTHQYIDCFDGMGYENAYDVLLDDFDEGLKTDGVREVFDELKTRPRSPDRGDRRARRPCGRFVPVRRLSDREAARFRARRARAVRLRPRVLATRCRPCTRSR